MSSRLSYDFVVRLGHNGLPGAGWPPRAGRKGTDRETAGRQGTGLEYDRPFLFLQARTDTGALRPGRQAWDIGKDERQLTTDDRHRHLQSEP